MGKKIALLFSSVAIITFGVWQYNATSTSFSIPISVQAQTSVNDWPQLAHDAQHSGRTTVEVAPNYKAAWIWADAAHQVTNFTSAPGSYAFKNDTMPTDSSVVAKSVQPIVYGGNVFFGTLEGIVYALNAKTGVRVWSFQTGGPIVGTLAASNNLIVVPSLDGNIYLLNSADGTKAGQITTGSGVVAAPAVQSGVAYVGSQDGKLYAIDLVTKSVKWTYETSGASASYYNKAPILAPAALSADGSTVLFGAENMYFYGINASNGTEKWTPKKLIGQSFFMSHPVVSGNRVIITTVSSLRGAEFVMESVLDGLPNCYTSSCWTAAGGEKEKILAWLSQNPEQKTVTVLDTTTGAEPFQLAMGRVTGNNMPPIPPVIDASGRPIMFWRSRSATMVLDTGATKSTLCYGTVYCPDISGIDLTNGDRIFLNNPSGNRIGPELDNGYALTIGGSYLYMANHWRGTASINLSSGALTRITTHSAKWDGGDFRGWGYQIIYFGNDGEPSNSHTNYQPVEYNANVAGRIGVAIANPDGSTPMLFINDGDGGVMTGVIHQ